MSFLNDADTRAKLIDPALRRAGWGESQIEREHYFHKDRKITAGGIYLVGEHSRRREPRRVDYLFRAHNALPIAVVEAKDESQTTDAGLERAKSYARMLDAPFAYSSNGHGFVEFDFFWNKSRELTEFPPPSELIRRLLEDRAHVVKHEPVKLAAGAPVRYDPEATRPKDPLFQPACPQTLCGKELRYFQEAAVNRVLERVVRGQQRILLTMATGTGKTFTAFQIVWKLKRSGWLRKPVLFLADRIVLRDQAYNTFAPFAQDQSDPRAIIQGGKANLNRDLYFSLYQALDSDEGTEPLFKRIPRDFFGLIIIDECHRSGFGKWNAILRHFPKAIQLGMTATPKQSESIDTYAYFCGQEPKALVDADDPSKGTWHPPDAALEPLISAVTRTRPTAAWLAALEAADVPCGPLNTIAQAAADPQIEARDMFATVEHPGVGPVRLVNTPMKFSRTPAAVRAPSPEMGQHTAEVLSRLAGVSADELELLRRDSVV